MTIHLRQEGHELDEAIRAITEEDAQVIVERDGKPLAVLVSPRYLALFNELAEEIEDRLDLEAYREAKQAFIESGEKSIPYEELQKSLGL